MAESKHESSDAGVGRTQAADSVKPLRSAPLRFGLCCQFIEQPIKFRTTTATSLLRMEPEARREKLSQLCLHNAAALAAAITYCTENEIGCFRINSAILPVKTHPEAGYATQDLPHAGAIVERFQTAGRLAVERGVRLVFHPDQFIVLNSPREEVVQRSIADLEYQAEVAAWVKADVINIHAGGAYGDKPAALDRLARNLDRLSAAARARITVENDDKIFTPRDLAAWCRHNGVPLVYDVHHHRCASDGWTVSQATSEALSTWDREPVFHISSPLLGWQGPRPERHHDFVDVHDFPSEWLSLAVTVEVEAKAKELAVRRLREALRAGPRPAEQSWENAPRLVR